MYRVESFNFTALITILKALRSLAIKLFKWFNLSFPTSVSMEYVFQSISVNISDQCFITVRNAGFLVSTHYSQTYCIV